MYAIATEEGNDNLPNLTVLSISFFIMYALTQRVLGYSFITYLRNCSQATPWLIVPLSLVSLDLSYSCDPLGRFEIVSAWVSLPDSLIL